MPTINEILKGNYFNLKFSINEQIEIIEQLKEITLNDLSKKERLFLNNVIKSCDETLIANYFLYLIDVKNIDVEEIKYDFGKLYNFKKINKILKKEYGIV